MPSPYPASWHHVKLAAARVALIAAAVGATSTARAAGVEDTIGGAEGLGRAANFGHVHDFMAIWQNPANLARAKPNVGLEMRVPWLQACYDRAADPNVTYRMDDAGNIIESFGPECRKGLIIPSGNLGWSESFGSWGMGVGFFTPAAVGASEWGSDTIVTYQPQDGERGVPTLTGIESPTRQMAIERKALGGFLMFGVAAQPTWWLRLGVGTGAGMVQLYNKSVTSAVGGTFNDTELINEFTVRDWIVGRASGSTVMSPLPGLDLFTVFNFHSDAKAKGDMTLTANGIDNVPTSKCVTNDPNTLTSKCKVEDVTLRIPFNPLEVTFGFRYALLRDGTKDVLDPIKDEIFDFEVDVNYAKTSNVQNFTLEIFDAENTDVEDFPRIKLANYDGAGLLYVSSEADIPKKWRDTWTVRAGGDVNIVPGKFSLRAGASYATNAVPPGYMNTDYWPVQKIGVHAGLTAALGEHLRMIIGYAHLFYQDTNILAGEGKVNEIAANQPNQATAVNEGLYTASQDIFSLQLNAVF